MVAQPLPPNSPSSPTHSHIHSTGRPASDEDSAHMTGDAANIRGDDVHIQQVAIRTQREEISRYRERLSARLGRSVSLDEAARAWIPEFASQWRREFEAGLAAMRRPISVASFLSMNKGENGALEGA